MFTSRVNHSQTLFDLVNIGNAPMIVIEGMDNSGKSTLARHIVQWFHDLTIQEGLGPPGPGSEINDRVKNYNRMDRTLFVRHPCVSNPIYDLVRPESERGQVDQALIDQFYKSKPVFIYCDPVDRGMDTHEIKEHDTVEHLRRITDGQDVLLKGYREWAIRHAFIVYRIGDDMERIVTALIGIDS